MTEGVERGYKTGEGWERKTWGIDGRDNINAGAWSEKSTIFNGTSLISNDDTLICP